MIELFKLKYFYIIFFSFIILTVLATNKISADQKIKITADKIQLDQNEETIRASGNAIAQDEKGSNVSSDLIIYDKGQSSISAKGNIIFNDIDGNTYFFQNLNSDDELQNLNGSEVRARLDDGSRLVSSRLVKKKENYLKIKKSKIF